MISKILGPQASCLHLGLQPLLIFQSACTRQAGYLRSQGLYISLVISIKRTAACRFGILLSQSLKKTPYQVESEKSFFADTFRCADSTTAIEFTKGTIRWIFMNWYKVYGKQAAEKS